MRYVEFFQRHIISQKFTCPLIFVLCPVENGDSILRDIYIMYLEQCFAAIRSPAVTATPVTPDPALKANVTGAFTVFGIILPLRD